MHNVLFYLKTLSGKKLPGTICEQGLHFNVMSSYINRLSDSENLFLYKPVTERRHQTERFFCLCSLDKIEKKKKCSNCESKCRRHQHVLWPAVTREKTITKRVQSLQIRRESERRHNFSNDFYSFGENPSNQLNRSGDDGSDSLLAVLAVISYCKRLLTGSPLARACTPLTGQQDLNQLVRICIRDMRVNMDSHSLTNSRLRELLS